MRSKVEIGTAIRALRNAEGLTQQQLAKDAAVTRSTLANIETGRQSIPLETLHRLAEVLQTSIGALIDEEDGGTVDVALLRAAWGHHRRIASTLVQLVEIQAALTTAVDDLAQLVHEQTETLMAIRGKQEKP